MKTKVELVDLLQMKTINNIHQKFQWDLAISEKYSKTSLIVKSRDIWAPG